jgi:hypothetical protein
LNDAGDPSGKIKVVDRRRFDDDGELRTEWTSKSVESPVPEAAADTAHSEQRDADPQPAPKPTPVADPPPTGPPPTEPSADRPPTEPAAAATSTLFVKLVTELAQQAAFLLTGAEDIPAQPERSQQLIDYLGDLETKTRGNLSAEETQLLSSVIFELRAAFVQRSS